MTDEELIKGLRGWHMAEMDAAADRIEELTNTHWQVDALQQNALLNDALTRAEVAEAKLAKAAQALRWAARYYDKIHPFQSADYHFKDCKCDFCGADCARAALAELEKTE
jgi:Uri superfamily endonuclease